MASASLPVRIAVVPTTILAGTSTAADGVTVAGVWGAVVEINGTNVTADVVGAITVEAEENAARVADFSLSIATGTSITIGDWLGKSVQIFFCDMTTGEARDHALIFTGVIDTPLFSPESGEMALRCTDNRQTMIGNTNWFASLFGAGYWSDAVFDRGPSGPYPNDILGPFRLTLTYPQQALFA